MLIPTDHPTAHAIDGGAAALGLASLLNILPAIASILSVIWFALRVAETRTVQKMLGKYSWIKDWPDDR